MRNYKKLLITQQPFKLEKKWAHIWNPYNFRIFCYVWLHLKVGERWSFVINHFSSCFPCSHSPAIKRVITVYKDWIQVPAHCQALAGWSPSKYLRLIDHHPFLDLTVTWWLSSLKNWDVWTHCWLCNNCALVVLLADGAIVSLKPNCRFINCFRRYSIYMN